MDRYDDWFNRKNNHEEDRIESNTHHRDWNKLNEHEKSQVYEREEGIV